MGKYKFSSELSLSEKNNRVIIFNTANGKWYKITKECMDIILLGIKKSLDQEKLITMLHSDDQEYFRTLFKKLRSLEIIVDEEKEKNEDLNFTIEITHRCNLNCIHCFIDAKTSDDEELISDLEMLQIIEKVISCEPKSITITGGEPLVRKNFWDIIDFIKKNYSGKLNLMTNGTLINSDNAKRLADTFSNFDISIDGVDEKTCSCIRGKGVFDKVINSVRLLQNNGVENISLSMVKTSYNYTEVDRFKLLNKELGTKDIIRVLGNNGRARAIYKNMLPVKEQNDNEITRTLKELTLDYNSLRCYSCGAGKKVFNIGADGYLSPCALLQYQGLKYEKVNDIDNLNKYLKNKEYVECEGYKKFQSFIPSNYSKCKKCDFKMFCWTCISDLIEKSSDDIRFNESCRSKKLILEKVWED